jgi:hypothetical protein
MMPKKLKTLTCPNADFRKQPSTDEKAYPTMEAAPKFRQSARWECCWPEAGIAAQELPSESSRRTLRGKVDTHCRPADLPTCALDSSLGSDASISFNSKVGNPSASVFSAVTARCNLPQFSLSHWKQRGTRFYFTKTKNIHK